MIQKQTLDISFAKGLDLKTDPWRVSPNNFLALQNSIFTKMGRLTKRNGFGLLSSITDSTISSLTTFQGNLTAIGNSFYAYNEDSQAFINKGSFRPLSLSVLSLIKNNYSQIQCDSATASNGAVCVAYTENQNGTSVYRYVVLDGLTGQVLVAPANITPTSGVVSGSPRVFVLGPNFVVVFTATIAAAAHLQYFSIGYTNFTVGSAVNITSAYTAASTVAFDGSVMNNTLYIAWNSSGGSGILMARLTSSLTLSSAINIDGSHVSTIMSVTNDGTTVYAAYYDSAGSTGWVTGVDQNINIVFSAKEWISTGTILSVTCAAISGVATIFYETSATYGYDSTIHSNFTSIITCTNAGVIGAASVLKRSVGLASKAFVVGTTEYVLTAFSSPYQPTYFLLDGSGNIVSELAYENGGGYLATGLPQVSVSGTTASIAYLFKDFISSLATGTTNVSQTPNIYSQTGINQVSFAIGGVSVYSSETAQTLNVTGGFLWSYDGSLAFENGFFLFPDSVEVSWNSSSSVTPTGTAANGATTIVLSSATGVYLGQSITDSTNTTYIPAGTIITAINGTTITMSQATIHAIAGDTIAIAGNMAEKPDGSTTTNAYFYQVTYEWSDNQGNQYRSTPSIPVGLTTSSGVGQATVNIPTLRLSYKTNVKIRVWRWSVAQESYYETTSILYPTINTPTTDYIAFVDANSDPTILGNALIYTTGGVIEDTSTPSASAITIFDNRVWIVDAENPNVLWYSKQVIQNTPVEMSDLFTLYVSPTQSAQGATGPITAIAPMDDKLIIFKKDAIYYINGTGPDNTGANSQYSQAIFITATVGSQNPNSLVLIPDGLMFQSDKGIWILGRDLSTQYIGNPVEDLTTSVTVNSSANIPATNQVRFTMSSGITLMYDYFFGQWGSFSGAAANSSTIYQSLHTLLTPYLTILQETPGLYVDNASPVLMSFTTAWINLAGLQGYQRSFFFYLLGQYVSPHKLQLYIAYDYSVGPLQSTLIQPTNFAGVYGGPASNPGDGTDYASPYGQDPTFGGATLNDELARGSVEQWRVFLAKQKCQAFQITLEELYDPTFGISPGQGLTLSGLNIVYGIKKGFRPIAAANSVGGGGNNL